MTPETVHLIAQLIRHERGALTACERWIKAQPASPSMAELQQVLETRRSVLVICERQIAAFDVDDGNGAALSTAQASETGASPVAPQHRPREARG